MEGKLVMRGDSLFLVDEIGECLVDPTEMIVKLREGQKIKNKVGAEGTGTFVPKRQL